MVKGYGWLEARGGEVGVALLLEGEPKSTGPSKLRVSRNACATGRRGAGLRGFQLFLSGQKYVGGPTYWRKGQQIGWFFRGGRAVPDSVNLGSGAEIL